MSRNLREQVLEILLGVESRGQNSSLLLERARFASDADRGLATELVLGSLRRARTLDALIAQAASRAPGEMDPGVRVALRLGAYQLRYLTRVPAFAAVDQTVEAAKRGIGRREAAFVNGVLRGLQRRKDQLALPGPDAGLPWLETTLGLPPFLARRWTQRWGLEAAGRLAAASLEPAEVACAVLRSRAEPARVIERLREEGIAVRPGRYLEETLVVESGSLVKSRVFAEGLVTIQDEAAQLVARLLAPRPGERVLDACAAPGGKSLALADLTQGQAGIVAADLRPGRLRLLRDNLKRAALPGIEALIMDAAQPAFAGTCFDRLLLDAPCTGTGTLRRNPELKERVDEAALGRSRQRARALLAALAPLVRPGGRLVYATCSLEPEENEEVVVPLLAAPRWIRIDPRADLPAAAAALVDAEGVFRSQPADLSLDGFTAFVYRRGADA